MYQYLFNDYYLDYILARMWDTSMSISNSAVFLHAVLDPLNKADLILATQKKLLFEYNYLKSITEGFSFEIVLRQTQVKHLALSSYTMYHGLF